MWRSIIVVAALLLAPAALAATTSKTVRDWTGTCDDYSCYARVTSDDGLASGGQGYQLEAARASGGDQAWLVTLIAHNVPQPGKEAVTFGIDGKAIDARLENLGDDRFSVSDQAALEAIFPALRKGSAVTIRFGDTEQRFSLSGIAAVLLWIDDVQGQVGNSDGVKAVEASGGGAAAGTDQAALEQDIRAASHLKECQWALEGEDRGDARFEAEVFDLSEGYRLAVVPCFMGAYQPATVVFLEGSGVWQPLPFADYGSDTGWGATLFLGTVDFDPKTLTLHNYAKFRGLGDCGTRSNFRWAGYGFKLLDYAYRDCPGADDAVDPDGEVPEFPIIYKAKD